MSSTSFWNKLTHQGVVISPVVLNEYLQKLTSKKDDSLPAPKDFTLREMRTRWSRFESNPKENRLPWIDFVLGELLAHKSSFLKRQEIPPSARSTTISGQKLAPDRLLQHADEHAIMVRISDEARLGTRGKGRRNHAKFLRLLRQTNCPVGLETNGYQWRLTWAGEDADAWVQWESESFFGDGLEPTPELLGFRALLGTHALTAVGGEKLPLHQAVSESRHRQGELSNKLGEQVRRAVEDLLKGMQEQVPADADLVALYQAATRIVMRLVVLFFAESDRRHLLPRENPTYSDHYGVEGLLSQLRQARSELGRDSLAETYGSWNRLLALFRLVYHGCDLGDTNIRAYGGDLFRPGDCEAADSTRRELARLEVADAPISDAQVLELLEGLKYTELNKIPAPVDFGDLSTEYIGILYEGLLDYELKRVQPHEQAVVRLAVGREPYLAFSRLEEMSQAERKDLLIKLKAAPATAAQKKKRADNWEDFVLPDNSNIEDRVRLWANDAVRDFGLKQEPSKLIPPETVYVPGQFYLVCWGGTRKGSGTYYTPPALATPTTRRTLQPLCHSEDGTPKSPQDILALRVCDPACGSGSFLVGALRYLTEAYCNSLESLLAEQPERPRLFPFGDFTDSKLNAEYIAVEDDLVTLKPEARRRAKRYVAQRCLFGVDLNPMAVELCRVALWIETLDPELPFEFFAHHVKCGNSLVGTWLDQISDYPLLAWARDGGSKQSTKLIKKLRKDVVKPEMKTELERILLAGEGHAQGGLFEEAKSLPRKAIVEETLDAFEGLQAIPVHDTHTREQYWRDEIRDNVHLAELRRAYNRWCAVWFWPITDESTAADVLPTPKRWYHHPESLDELTAEITAEQRFFHWELEFPEVFCRAKPEEIGFDAIIGNPPWDTVQPMSQEFFSNHDPVFRTYDKQFALKRQESMIRDNPQLGIEWVRYQSGFKQISNYSKLSNSPCADTLPGGRKFQESLKQWTTIRDNRETIVPSPHPFQFLSTGKIDLYRAFLEIGHALVRQGGRLGCVVPSGLYTDRACSELRSLFLDHSRWDWLFAFENRRKVFDIDSRFKFCPIIVQKGGETQEIKCAFMRHDLEEWGAANPPHLKIKRETISRFSPGTRSLMEFKSQLDIDICEKIYHNRPLLQDRIDDGWQVDFSQEFNMTSDSHLFIPRQQLVDEGLLTLNEDTSKQDALDRLLEAGYVPLQEGKHIWQWDDRRADHSRFMRLSDLPDHGDKHGLCWRSIASDTNERTVVAAPVTFRRGHGNSLWSCWCPSAESLDVSVSWLASVIFDWVYRLSSEGMNVQKSMMLRMPWWKSEELELLMRHLPPTPVAAPAWDAFLAHHLGITEAEFSYILDAFPVAKSKDPDWAPSRLRAFNS